MNLDRYKTKRVERFKDIRKELDEVLKGDYLAMKIFTINAPVTHLLLIEKLIQAGLYMSRSDFIRRAIESQLDRDFKRDVEFQKIAREGEVDDGLIRVPGGITYKFVREA